MTIDIQPGDTFTIWPNGAILQYRSTTTRWLDDEMWASGGAGPCPDERIIERADVINIITAAGHTIEEVQPKYIEPPRPGMFDNPPPAAPAPLSHNERECWTLMQTFLRENFNRANGLQNAIEKMLLAEGGAK